MNWKNKIVTAMMIALPMSFAAHAKTFVYVSNADSGKISHYELNEKSGSLAFVNEIESGAKAMPTVISSDKKYLYSATRKAPYSIVAWKIDPETGDLTEKTVNSIHTSYVMHLLPWIKPVNICWVLHMIKMSLKVMQ